MPVRAVKRGCRLMALSRGVEAIGAATNPQKLIFLTAELGGVRGTSSMPLKTRVTSPVRREALVDRVEVRDHRRRPVAAGR